MTSGPLGDAPSTVAVLLETGELFVDGEPGGGSTTRQVALDGAGMDALRECIVESRIAELVDDQYGSLTAGAEPACSQDRDEVTIRVDWPDVATTVTAYGLGRSTSPASMGGDCGQGEYPESLRLVYGTLTDLVDRAREITDPER